MTTTVKKQVLINARALIANPANWTRGMLAGTSEGQPVEWHASSARKWCAAGAIYRAAYDLIGDEREAVRLGNNVARSLRPHRWIPGNLPRLNDVRGHAAVLAVFDKTIQTAWRTLRRLMSTHSGKAGMGSHKHAVSGIAGRSPRFKHNQQREENSAAREKAKRDAKKKHSDMFGSVQQAMERLRIRWPSVLPAPPYTGRLLFSPALQLSPCAIFRLSITSEPTDDSPINSTFSRASAMAVG
jgi:hypothetical protein